ncbi:hypothetical protein KO561_14040 [Radiobacillus kanasensis]|uniref:tubby C-terminal domain-like protein n=1 Tax=Radiobacillus kanasensis TaxID=2844358 RepID=UPI001E4A4126|nr:hypothetical protein [Radiobacillus kanasensis]UFT98315.1 hypothetical protein KO561_14040 [Radiobacillus kanasensis]
MGRLLTLFVVGTIGLLLRFLIKGEFELDQLLLLFLFPVASVVILLIKNNQIKKDAQFQPNGDAYDIQTRMAERFSTSKKVATKGDTILGNYHRFHKKGWHKLLTNIMDSPGKFYINFEFNFPSRFKFVEVKEHAIIGNSKWEVYEDDRLTGTIETDYSVKNATNLKEKLILQYGEDTYIFHSFGVGSETKVEHDQLEVARGTRKKGAVYGLTVTEAYKDHESLLFAVFILFNYVFEQ